MICFAFPLAHEAAPLLKQCTQKETFSIDGLHCTLGNLQDRRVLIALVGMGQKKARANTEAIFTYFRPSAFILSGYGGALIPKLKVGQVLIATNYTSSEVASFVRLLTDFDFAIFATADEVIGAPEQRDRLQRTTRGQVIEMETAAVAEVIKLREVPFAAIRVISDDYAHVLPVKALAAGFDVARGTPTPLRLIARLALHWNEIGPFCRFVGNLSTARKNLTSFLLQLNKEIPRGW